MKDKKRDKPSKQGASRVSAWRAGEIPNGGAAGHTLSFAGKLVSFFKNHVFLTFALSVISVFLIWFLLWPRLEIVVFGVVLLQLGGVFWLASLVWKRKGRTPPKGEPRGDAPFLNETHDRRDHLNRFRETPESLIPHSPRGSLSSEDVLLAKLSNLEDTLKAFVRKVNEIEGRLTELEQELYYPTGQKRRSDGKPRSEALAYDPPKRPTPYYDFHQEPRVHASAVDLQTLNQSICRFLAEESGSWAVERLVQSVELTTGGNASIEVKHLVPHSSGEWRLVALWPQHSQEGLALVSAGELVDDDIAKYFDVSFGRRIISCRQPARVSRGGGEVTVLQKGRVESS